MLSAYHRADIVPGTVAGTVLGTGQMVVTTVDKSLFVELITYGRGGKTDKNEINKENK